MQRSQGILPGKGSWFLFFVALLFISACGEHSHKKDNAHEHGKGTTGSDHGDGDAKVHLTSVQARNAAIRTAHPQRMDLAKSIQATGKLELPPDNKAAVSPTVGGNVQAVHVIQGEKVDAGDVLAVLSHPDIVQLQETFLEDREELRYLKQELERKRSLYADSVGAARELQKARSEYEQVRARIHTQSSKLESMGIDTASLRDAGDVQDVVPIRSPLHGVVSEVNISLGSYAAPNEELFRILNIHHMHIDLMVYEKDLHKVAVGQHVLFDLVGRDNPQPMRAEIFGLGNAIDEERKAAKVHAEIRDTLGPLFPGIYVEAMIDVDSAREALVVPEEAVLRFEGAHYLFLAQGGGNKEEQHFERVRIHRGIRERGYVEVEGLEKALSKKDRVVISGAPYLLRHMRKGSGGHGH